MSGVDILILFVLAVFSIVAAYKVRHPEKSFVQLVKSWFK